MKAPDVDLLDLNAAKVGIEGRSHMTWKELVSALRNH
jgi:hypothetical protein